VIGADVDLVDLDLDSAAARHRVARVDDEIEEDLFELCLVAAISRLRHLLFELRPPALDSEGLVPALRAYLDEAEANSSASFRLEDALRAQPPERLRAILYRIAQEAITNARKHSEATEIVVAVEEQRDGFVLRVTDNGVGFDVSAETPRAGHLGLVAMRKRAELAGGTLRTESERGLGTTVELWIPREDQPDGSALA